MYAIRYQVRVGWLCSDRMGNPDVIMGYSVAGMYIVVMVHGRWILGCLGNHHNDI